MNVGDAVRVKHQSVVMTVYKVLAGDGVDRLVRTVWFPTNGGTRCIADWPISILEPATGPE